MGEHGQLGFRSVPFFDRARAASSLVKRISIGGLSALRPHSSMTALYCWTLLLELLCIHTAASSRRVRGRRLGKHAHGTVEQTYYCFCVCTVGRCHCELCRCAHEGSECLRSASGRDGGRHERAPGSDKRHHASVGSHKNALRATTVSHRRMQSKLVYKQMPRRIGCSAASVMELCGRSLVTRQARIVFWFAYRLLA